MLCLYHLFEGEGRQDELTVLSPCCSSLISLQLSADRQNAVSTDWMWHISLVIMWMNHFPAGESKPCVGNLGTGEALEPWPRRECPQYCKNPSVVLGGLLHLVIPPSSGRERNYSHIRQNRQLLKSRMLAVCFLENTWHFRGNSLCVVLVEG